VAEVDGDLVGEDRARTAGEPSDAVRVPAGATTIDEITQVEDRADAGPR
jgi:hypothetical protein